MTTTSIIPFNQEEVATQATTMEDQTVSSVSRTASSVVKETALL